MDEFLLKTSQKFSLEDLLPLGLTCIFMAGKLEEISPFSLKSTVKNIGHNNVKKKTVLKLESEIL